MAEYLIDKAYLVALADAIRKKSGSSSKMTPSAMVSAINNLGDMTYTPQSSPTVINKTGELYTIQDTTFNSLAKAIRNKAGISDKMTPHKMIDVIGRLHEVKKTAFAVFSADDNSFNFYKRAVVPNIDTVFNGKTATAVYTGIETNTYGKVDDVPWSSICSQVTSSKAVDKIKPISMAFMFCNFSSLINLDVSNFDVSNVTSMKLAFNRCSKLTSLNVSGWDTSSVIDMSNMFAECSSLTSLDLSNFNTSNVTNMGNMFGNCSKLSSLNVSKFDTSKVTGGSWALELGGMQNMFAGCSSLTSLDISSFNTSNVTNMGGMFKDCSNLSSLNVSRFDTSKVTDMGDMFNNCSNLTSLNVSGFNTGNVTNMGGMFGDCSRLTSLNISGFNTGNVTNIAYMFNRCSNLTSLDVSRWNTGKVTTMVSTFSDCSKLVTDCSMWDVGKVRIKWYFADGAPGVKQPIWK